ncbi:amidohydrolase [Glacieibacterium frigidum]|uniref:amidohydrolase n=1 Tax=Glacieibacterium frigidum TaxID=2593303 RepID=UPI001F4483C0|nr:amidohydrolase [Glacieibacterium frigidum]
MVVNANGYTLDGGKLVRFSTLVVGDDGRVAGTATTTPAKGDTVVDAGGRTLLPGLIDAHGHVMDLGYKALAVDLSDTTSLDAALAKIKAYAAANPNAPWIIGSGWNQERWGLGRFPTAAELDRAVPDRPAWLERVDGHAGWANTRALAAGKVVAATPAPAGGSIERLAGGAPGGVLVDAAMALVNRAVPKPTPAQSMAALDKAMAILASVGLTQAADMGVEPGTWQLYRKYEREGRLTLRIAAYAAGIDALGKIARAPVRWSGSERLALNGVKLYGDGALGSRGAWLKADYTDAPGNRGLQFNTDAELRAQVGKAASQGFDIAVHAIGDAADAQALDVFAGVTAPVMKRIEHAQIVDPADLSRFAKLGVVASMQPTHATSDKGMAEARLGEARLAGGYAWATLIKSGAAFAGGSDFPVEPPHPFYGWHAAVTRQDRGGQPLAGWRVGEALTGEQAFAAFTTGAAAANRSVRTGTLVPGQWADFILVDADPFVLPADGLWKIGVEETWVGGKRVFKR